MKRATRYLNYALNAVLFMAGIVGLWVMMQVLMFDSYPVRTESMMPTIEPGDRILVNKMVFGARIYEDLDFLEEAPLNSWRMPGFRRIRHNELVVFNHVRYKSRNKIQFNLGTIFVKRCIGLPGDTLSIVNGYYRNSSLSGKTLGIYEEQERLSRLGAENITPAALGALKYARPQYHWTILDLGPFYIPRAGDTLVLDSVNYKLYAPQVEYETGQKLSRKGSCIFLGKNEATEYVFQKNYYFMAGDHAANSNDSRYWGLVPEDFIIGVCHRIFYSRDPDDDTFIRRRFMKKI